MHDDEVVDAEETYSVYIPLPPMGRYTLKMKRNETVGTLEQRILELENWEEQPKLGIIKLFKVTIHMVIILLQKSDSYVVLSATWIYHSKTLSQRFGGGCMRSITIVKYLIRPSASRNTSRRDLVVIEQIRSIWLL